MPTTTTCLWNSIPPPAASSRSGRSARISPLLHNVTTLATAAFLDDAGLSQDYLNYQINYPDNTNEKVRQTGLEVAARQRINRWLSLFSNLSLNRNQGPRETDFRGYVRKRVNAGFTLTRNPITFNANFYYTPKIFTGTNAIAPDGRTYTAARYRVDASIDFRVSKRVSLFVWGRNIFDERDKT